MNNHPRYEIPCHICGRQVPVWRPKPIVMVCNHCHGQEGVR